MAITASITSLGVGSGIQAENIVSKLMAIERAPLEALDLREASYQAKISAFGSLKTKFDAFETAAGNLADPAKLAAFTATIGDEDIVAATAGTLANAGSYNVNVTQLAQAQKSFTGLYGASDTFAAGTLSFTIGGDTIDVNFAGGSINDLRAAINDADLGITATTVTGDAGTRLVLTAEETGTDSAFSLAVTGGDANLQSLATFDAANPNARVAQNAVVEIEGETITSQSNQISTAITDVTFTAKAVGATTVDIARSDTSALDTVKAFVTAYNDIAKELRTVSAYDAGTKKAGALNGDATVRTLQGLLRNAIGAAPAELEGTAYENLSALGISFKTDGTISLDETKFKKAAAHHVRNGPHRSRRKGDPLRRAAGQPYRRSECDRQSPGEPAHATRVPAGPAGTTHAGAIHRARRPDGAAQHNQCLPDTAAGQPERFGVRVGTPGLENNRTGTCLDNR
jgi:flagellar hook-associated protein 2